MSSLACAFADCIKLWELESDSLKLVSKSQSRSENSSRFSCLAWAPSNQLLAASFSSSKVNLLRPIDASIISTIELPDLNQSHVSSLDFSTNSRFLAISAEQSTFVWDFKRSQFKFSLTAHDADIVDTVFYNDHNLVTADKEGSIRLWELDQKDKCTLYQTESAFKLTSLDISQSFKIASGYEDGYLRIWDPVTGKVVRNQSAHKGVLNTLSFSPKNPRLIMSASQVDKRISLIDILSRSVLEPSACIDVGKSVRSISFHENAVYVAAGLDNGKVFIYDWRNTKAPVIIQQQQHGNLSPVSFVAFQRSSNDAKLSTPPKLELSNAAISNSIDMGSTSAAATVERECFQIGKSDKMGKPSVSGATKQQSHDVSGDIVANESTVDTATLLRRTSLRKETRVSIDTLKSAYLQEETEEDGFEDLRQAVRPVNHQELNEALSILKYDIHREMQVVMREQIRQFEIAKAENVKLIEGLSQQLQALLVANQELRAENEKLRRIY